MSNLAKELRLIASGYVGSSWPTIVSPLFRAADALEQSELRDAVVDAAVAEREAYRAMDGISLDIPPGTPTAPIDAWIDAVRVTIEAVDALEPTAEKAVSCGTCGSTDPEANTFCSNIFHFYKLPSGAST